MSQTDNLFPANEDLRRALRSAREHILLQEEALADLTGEPVYYAMVLATGNGGQPMALFRRGARVRVLSGPAQDQYGRIISNIDGDGDVVVLLDDGRRSWVRVRDQVAGGPGNNPKVRVVDGPSGKWCLVTFEGKLLQVTIDSGLQVSPGQYVALSSKTLAVVGLASGIQNHGVGTIATLKEKLGEGVYEVDYQGDTRVVCCPPGLRPVVDERVVLDPTGMMIIRNLGIGKNPFAFSQKTNVSWDDIGGLEAAKSLLMEAVVWPRQYRNIFERFGREATCGILFFGPPGCGKTMLGKAVATEVARLNGAQDASGFMYIRGPELLSKYLGDPEAAVRRMFAHARHSQAQIGYPAVIFIDEADAILRTRGTGISSDFADTLVPMFLAEMSGLASSGAIVILATNRPDRIDPAVLREGRMDLRILVDRPKRNEAAHILRIHIAKVPTDGCDRAVLADRAVEEIFADKHPLVTIRTRRGELIPLSLRHVVSGAMLAGLVERATSAAIRREVKSGRASSVTMDDMLMALPQIASEYRELDLSDVIYHAVEGRVDEVAEIMRPKG